MKLKSRRAITKNSGRQKCGQPKGLANRVNKASIPPLSPRDIPRSLSTRITCCFFILIIVESFRFVSGARG